MSESAAERESIVKLIRKWAGEERDRSANLTDEVVALRSAVAAARIEALAEAISRGDHLEGA